MGAEALLRVDLSAARAPALAIAVCVVPALASCTRADVRGGERAAAARGATTATHLAARDGTGDATGPMLPVPAGVFAMGSLDGDDDERPVHIVSVAAFTIGATEVTARAYGACVAAKACPPAGDGPYCNGAVPSRADHPINCVAWSDAKAFCAWAGGRLPTEAQWEYAARGSTARPYPWGEAPPRAQLCWDGPGSELGLGKRRGTCPVGRYPDGRGPFGALDMAGNVWEWTADAYSEDYGAEALSAAAAAPAGALRVVRGGTWFGYDAEDVRAGAPLPRAPRGAQLRHRISLRTRPLSVAALAPGEPPRASRLACPRHRRSRSPAPRARPARGSADRRRWRAPRVHRDERHSMLRPRNRIR